MEKIKKLKKYFKEENIDGYIIQKNDEFFGEYIADYNDRLNYISNFSGSYGFALILKNISYLFVDGRYTLQAKAQSGKLFKIITFPHKMPNDILKDKKLTIGFDPKLITKQFLNIFFKSKNCKFKPLKNNLIDQIDQRMKLFISKKLSISENDAFILQKKFYLQLKKFLEKFFFLRILKIMHMKIILYLLVLTKQ